ncbi:hypothetical protein [Candidatus Skiveiella danica]|uniref:hypothetical protein n=1 Tax=Candidatus Skiveiella danica TaxID=3386177 RepID=UPI001DE1093F|nr:hypothetical protein [Betaproteobacteria bacterium]
MDTVEAPEPVKMAMAIEARGAPDIAKRRCNLRADPIAIAYGYATRNRPKTFSPPM